MISHKILPPSPLGIIGLGSIGLPIANNLFEAGFQLSVYSKNIESKKDILKNYNLCFSPQEVASKCEALILCLPDDKEVDLVLFGKKGVANKLKEDSVVIDCSTISPFNAKSNAKQLIEKKIYYLDAPVTGGTEGASAGKLTILVGGEEVALRRVSPILEVFGKDIFHFGETGRGQEVKAINQILVASSYVGVAEAIALGEELKLPMNKVITALQTGAASSWALKNRSLSMLKDTYPLGFKLKLHNKDLKIALDLAKRLAIELPITSNVFEIEKELLKKGYQNEDISVLRRWFRSKLDKNSK